MANCSVAPPWSRRISKLSGIASRVLRFEAAGDFSHSDPEHECLECTCQKTAGAGTDHLGVGWCNQHEKSHPNAVCEKRVELMTAAIRAGAPNSVWQYKSNGKYLKKVQEEAALCKGAVNMREQQVVLIDLAQRLLDYIDGGNKPDGEKFTESGKDGPREASDATMFTLFTKLSGTMAKLAQVELSITDPDYTHWDECQVFFLAILKVVENVTDKETFDKIMTEIREVPQPKRGRKRNR